MKVEKDLPYALVKTREDHDEKVKLLKNNACKSENNVDYAQYKNHTNNMLKSKEANVTKEQYLALKENIAAFQKESEGFSKEIKNWIHNIRLNLEYYDDSEKNSADFLSHQVDLKKENLQKMLADLDKEQQKYLKEFNKIKDNLFNSEDQKIQDWYMKTTQEVEKSHKQKINFLLEEQENMNHQVLDTYTKGSGVLQKAHTHLKDMLANAEQLYARNILEGDQKNQLKIQDMSLKKDDPFYKACMLNVSLTEDANAITIKTQIPSYDQDSMRLQYQDNALCISNIRKFDTHVMHMDGTINATHNYQTYWKKIPLPCLIDQNKITVHKDDHDVTITLPKKRAAISSYKEFQ